MHTKILGLGLKYKNEAGEKIVWLYYPDLYWTLYKARSPIVDKFESRSFSTKLNMTTYRSGGPQPRKIDESESLALLLAEVDFETSAWVYLLDEDLAKN